MSIKRYLSYFLPIITLCGFLQTTHADNLLMARVAQTFPEAMLSLQDTLRKQGYTISRVQRVDVGLTNSGYKTDKYRVVFFGKPDEINRLSQRYLHLVPYLPLKIAIFAEEDNTLLVAASPLQLINPKNPELDAILKRWEKDLQSVFTVMGEID